MHQDPLHNSEKNLNNAFSEKARKRFEMELPALGLSEEKELKRILDRVVQMSPIEAHAFMIDLKQQSDPLFCNLIRTYTKELLPLMYTPTVGEVAQKYSSLFNRPWGLFLHAGMREEFDKEFCHLPKEAEIFVVTDGSAVLGIGDQGLGGMAISQAKASLYTVFGGVDPKKVVPVVIDLGTDNKTLREDPLYLGLKKPRISDEEFVKVLDHFVRSLMKKFPEALIHWEDFSRPHSQDLLEHYQDSFASFNDDIEGSAVVALGGILAGCSILDIPLEKMRFMIYGSGSCGMGIVHLIHEALKEKGLSNEEINGRFFLFDKDGFIWEEAPNLDPRWQSYAHKKEALEALGIQVDKLTNSSKDLSYVIECAKPHVLVGASSQKDAFDEKSIKALCSAIERPIIFPLSNPKSQMEAQPQDLLKWTEGTALIATGSPFDPIEGVHIGQCNNLLSFPAIGLAKTSCNIKKITPKMLLAMAKHLCLIAPIHKDPKGALYPGFKDSRGQYCDMAYAFAKAAQKEGTAPQMKDSELKACIEKAFWSPEVS